MENKRRKLDASFFAIVDAIKEFSEGVKEIEKMIMEMTERIATYMLQSEWIGRELIVQGQMQMATLFDKVLKPKDS
jgi:uncharacterized protein YoxC